ncbi:hypothetical protein [Methanogenium organophilum]|uniref:Uncharacterized protein n=1 Tax=Methanogenium organophilum TaxID=2199 RepID=A0A9X9S3C4_METOG|nr:hypothetical protein [Methanogenium organophilum]WAI00170.1 hypothetical protein OU421_06925 [Methanogenium organophilum]
MGGTVGIKKAGHTLPLRGIPDYWDFERSSASLGNCMLCGDGTAVYHSKEQRGSVSETYYVRLVREWNRG